MLCAIAKLDSLTTLRLRELQKEAARFGLEPKPVYGHITLACYLGDDAAPFISACEELLSGIRPFEVRYREIEVLDATSIIVASPEEGGVLSEIHERIAERFPDELDEWTRPGAWKPHTTLVYKPDADLDATAGAMRGVFSPFSARIGTVEFSLVSGSGYEIINRFRLA